MTIWLIIISLVVGLLVLRVVLRAIDEAHHAEQLKELTERAKKLNDRYKVRDEPLDKLLENDLTE